MNDASRLVGKVVERDAAAFEKLYDAYHHLVYEIACERLRDTLQAEDLTQAVFLKFWNMPNAFDGGDFGQWILTITRNRADDLVRNAPPENASASAGCKPLRSAQSERMKQQIFSCLRAQADAKTPLPTPGHLRSRQIAYALAAGAGFLALLCALRAVTLDAELRTSQEHITRLHERINDQARASAEQNARIADLFSADGQHYVVPGGEIVRRNHHLYLAMRSLPKLPAGHVFQAWTLLTGTTIFTPSITFTPNHQGMAIVQLPIDAAQVTAVSVSIEPEGGSKEPSTGLTLIGRLSYRAFPDVRDIQAPLGWS